VFGISFAKLLVLGIVVAAVWFGIRWLQDQTRPQESPRDAVRKPAPGPAPSAAGRAAASTEDLTKCPVCGTYVARGAPRCDRADCPAALHG
jgi:uncharacterized protein